MNIIRSSIKSQALDLKTLPIFSPLKISVKTNSNRCSSNNSKKRHSLVVSIALIVLEGNSASNL